MKPAALASLLLILFLRTAGQSGYWQQSLRYDIRVTLDDASHTLDGDLTLGYVNHSPDTLRNIWFHLWPNAYKNDRTAFSEQMLQNGNTEFYFSNPEDKGYINGLDFRMDGRSLRTLDHPSDIDILNVYLPAPLAPGDSIILTTPFHVKLPRNFSRGGHHGNQYTITQWYPKPAVYDKQGWHTMPYLDQGEYYADFGTYDVHITVPEKYIVAATGVLEGGPQRTTNNEQRTTQKTFHFVQSNIHDFAWFADKDYYVEADSVLLPSGRKVNTFVFAHLAAKNTWAHAMKSVKDAVRLHSEWIGEYPYDVVTVVEGIQGNPSGMEYPTISFIHDLSDSGELRATIFHEVGHNWLQGALANDERRFPWMDEGLNTFYDRRYLEMAPLPRKRYRSRMESLKAEWSTFDHSIREAAHLDQPISTPSDSMHMLNYDAITYHKTAVWLEDLERSLGRPPFDSAMQRYYKDWAFRHPSPEDLKAAFREKNKERTDAAFASLDRTGPLPGHEAPKTRVVFGSPLKNDGKYRYVLINPMIGYNLYDGLMPALTMHNYSPPASRFQYAASVMYGLSSKKINGIGRISYSFYPAGPFRKVDLFLSGAHFSMDRYTDSSGKAWFQTFTKVTPGLRLEFRNRDMRSSLYRYLQYKMYSIREDQLNIRRDTVLNRDEVSLINSSYLLHQFTASWEDMRKLYPYKGELRAEFTKELARISFTGRYFFNFRRKGGVDLRLYAGKFFYLGHRTPYLEFQSERFHLNMTGPKGYEDYTYSDYFFGRNVFEGLNSQQIMERDGFFKVHTDQLGAKVGKTDDWLVATNLVVDIPDRFNPLAILPIKIPLKLFADIGTQAGAWGKDADGRRLLFDGGLALSLLHSRLRIYIPLVYSSAYGDYFKSTPGNNFFQRISFSLDLREDNFRKIFRQGFE